MPTDLHRLARADVTWEGGILPLSQLVESVPSHASRDHAVLWWEVEAGEPVRMLAYEPSELPESAAELVLEAMRAPMERAPIRPARLRVDAPPLAAAVREAVVGLDIDVVTGPLSPGWLDSARLLADLLVPKVPVRSYVRVADVEPERAARFCRAAAAYRRADHTVLLETDTVVLDVKGRPEPLYAWVLDPGLRDLEGLALYTSQRDFAQRYRDLVGPDVPPGGSAIAVVFEPEEAVAPSLRREQRLHGWELADSESFPIAYWRSKSQVRPPTGSELELLATVLEALAASLGRRHVELKGRGPVRDAVETGEAGRRISVAVHYPRRTPAPVEAWLVAGAEDRFVEWAHAEAQPLRALREAVAALPHTRATLRRLAWSFFRDARPAYSVELDDMLDEDCAIRRFVDWAVFMTRRLPGVPTLAQEAILAGQVPGDERTMRRLARARYSVFKVERVESDGRGWLRDSRSDVEFRIRRAPWLAELRPGTVLVGPVFTLPDHDHAPGALAAVEAATADRVVHMLAQRPAAKMPPALEAHRFGATAAWIHQTSYRDYIEAAYEDFREALGGVLPAASELADRPGLVPHTNGGRPPATEADLAARWWTLEERDVYRTFVSRLAARPATGR